MLHLINWLFCNKTISNAHRNTLTCLILSLYVSDIECSCRIAFTVKYIYPTTWMHVRLMNRVNIKGWSGEILMPQMECMSGSLKCYLTRMLVTNVFAMVWARCCVYHSTPFMWCLWPPKTWWQWYKEFLLLWPLRKSGSAGKPVWNFTDACLVR